MREARHLTPRERECLHWVAHGKTHFETSLILGISTSVVKNHLDNARMKLGATNLTHAVAIAVSAGFIEIDHRRAALFALHSPARS
jgi:DNA-binding CsgD family transcriptional regulator